FFEKFRAAHRRTRSRATRAASMKTIATEADAFAGAAGSRMPDFAPFCPTENSPAQNEPTAGKTAATLGPLAAWPRRSKGDQLQRLVAQLEVSNSIAMSASLTVIVPFASVIAGSPGARVPLPSAFHSQALSDRLGGRPVTLTC